jgi:RNA polymerase sigma factor (sigma-70 family)
MATLTAPDIPPRTTGRRNLAQGEIAKLVARAADGDQRSWDRLVDQFSAMVWAVARAHRLEDADAADVSQATWLRLVQHVGRLDKPERVGAWLATTARRESLRVLRDAPRRGEWDDDAAECESPDPAPGGGLLLAERDDALSRALACLRPRDQSLLRMLMSDPRPSYEEIAAALDMPMGSIGPTRARALERLRLALEADGTLALMLIDLPR